MSLFYYRGGNEELNILSIFLHLFSTNLSQVNLQILENIDLVLKNYLGLVPTPALRHRSEEWA